jgi:hypothetical protein
MKFLFVFKIEINKEWTVIRTENVVHDASVFHMRK